MQNLMFDSQMINKTKDDEETKKMKLEAEADKIVKLAMEKYESREWPIKWITKIKFEKQ